MHPAVIGPALRGWLLRRGRALRAGRRASLLGELARRPGRLALFLFDQPGIGLVAIDRAGAVVRANAALAALAGADARVAAGAPVAAMFAEPAREAAAAEIGACLRGQSSRPVFAAVLRSGAAVGVTALPIRAADGQIVGALLRLVDLSGQRELEAQLAQAQKMQAVGQLAGGIAHDFNNLLTAIQGAAESVASRDDLAGEAIEDVAQIRASAGRGAALVRQLLAFGRQQTLQPRVLPLNDVVAEISGLLRRLIGNQIRLELDLEQPGRQVCADPTQLDQVLVNLAVNARDAMPDGGTLTVRTGHLTLHRAQDRGAEVIPPGRYVMVEVADTGLGIAPDILPRIFEPFFTTRREQGGSGLGLSTVHGIVRQSEGFVDLDSVLGEGTRVRVYLPRADDRAMAIPELPAHVPAGAPRPLASGTILVVDDEAPVRILAQRALSRAGWRVLVADSGEHALLVLAEHPGVRLAGLVTDMAMHGMDGVEVVRAVRAQLGQPVLPALLVSGYAEAALRGALAGQARVVFLAKPYGLSELVEAVAAMAAGGPVDELFPPADLSVAMSQATNI